MLTRKSFVFLTLLFAFSSCQKILDYYNLSHHEKPSQCKIDSINYYGASDGILYHSMDFQYNEDGRLKGVFEEYPVTDPEQIFADYWPYLYDAKGRLVRTGPLSTPQPFGEIYVYEGDSPLPARDTMIVMGGPTVEDFEYDSQGRIIKIKQRFFAFNDDPNEPEIHQVDSLIIRYYYDLRGNRQEHPSNEGYSGLITYSDKPSLYSLSPALQIQYRDWSRYSTLKATSYNEYGLPLKLAPDQPHLQPLINMQGGHTIAYECE